MTHKKLMTFLFLLAVVLNFAEAQQITIQQAVKLAKANNTILKSEKLNVNIVEGDLITARLRPNPSLNNQSLQLTKSSLYPENTQWHNAINRQVWWQLTKPFQLPSQRKYKIELANQQITLTQNSYSETERNLVFDVAAKWLDAWRIKQMLSILGQAQVNLDSLVLIQKARLRNQVINPTELIRVQIPLEQYNLQLKTTRQEYLNTLHELKFLTGSTDSIDVDIESPIETFTISQQRDSLLQMVMRSRADIRTIQSSIAVSESNIRLQNSLKWPQPELGFIWNPQNTVPYVGFFGTIELPFFSRNQGEISKSLAIKRQAEQNLQTVQAKINTEIKAAYQTWQLQKENLNRYALIVQQSNEVLRSVRYAYLKGGTTLIDLLEAQRSWYDTQQLYYDAQTNYYQSYLKLMFTTGFITQL